MLGTLTPEERDELNTWIGDDKDRKEILDRLCDPQLMAHNFHRRTLVETHRPRKEMVKRLGLQKKRVAPAILATLIGVAAVVALIFIFINPYSEPYDSNILAAQPQNKELDLDSLTPGSSVAYVVKGDRKIPLKSESGNRGTSMLKIKDVVEKNKPVVLEVPRGGEFIVVLDDSTKVWLNSASSITYPENFSAQARNVKITGEAYFSVTKDAEHPFTVDCDGQTIRVYGTEFNVRSYPEESSVYTSLAEGSVSIVRTDGHGGELILSPGTQSVFDKQKKSVATQNVNIETVTGWRHGRFVFENQTLQQIMNDLSRWYDFEFEFEDPSLQDTIFMGSIPRYGDFSTAMLILEKSGGVKFKSDGNKILISHI